MKTIRWVDGSCLGDGKEGGREGRREGGRRKDIEIKECSLDDKCGVTSF